MKIGPSSLLLVLACLTVVPEAAAQGTRFFRISGPAPTSITAFNPDGTLVWSNALPGTNYMVQTASSLGDGSNWVDYIRIPVTNSVNTNQLIDFNPPPGMTLIPAGMFTIGDSVGDTGIADAGPTNVTVSAFYMDTNLVSYGQWQSVYNWAVTNGYGFYQSPENPPYVAFGKTSNNPVGMLDWYDCVKWCNARSQLAGLTPVYYTNTNLTQIYTSGEWGLFVAVPVYANWSANGYRLPTEAEWEKAARGGLTGCRFPWGNLISEALADYTGDTTNGISYDLGPDGPNPLGLIGGMPPTCPVGSFPPNGYGLYDMAGNEGEWCWDWYGEPPYPASGPYPPGSAYLGGTDPHGPDSSPTYTRVSRGGFPGANSYWLRTFLRLTQIPEDPHLIGFRCVRGF